MARPPSGQVLELERDRGRVFALRYRAGGKRRYETLAVGTTRLEAQQQLRGTLADIERGLWHEPEPPPIFEEREEPDFHRFSSDYVEARRQELRPRSVEALAWALSNHLLPVFQHHRLSAITAEAIDRYRVAKVREREQGIVERPLSNGSINKTIAVLARVLDQAVEYGWLETNPARGKRRRLKAEKPRRTWLELDEVRALLDAAGDHRPMLATMILAGLRVSEACALRWRDVDLARGRLQVAAAKTSAGVRVVDLSPDLLDELKSYKAGPPRRLPTVTSSRLGAARPATATTCGYVSSARRSRGRTPSSRKWKSRCFRRASRTTRFAAPSRACFTRRTPHPPT